MSQCESSTQPNPSGVDSGRINISIQTANEDTLSLVKVKSISSPSHHYYNESPNRHMIWTVAIVSCVVNFLYGCVTHGITGIVAVHLERRYSYESVYTGVIMTGNDVAAILLGPLVGHYCNRKHCARWMGVGAILVAVGCLMFTLPHSLSLKYTPSNVQTNYTNLCLASQAEFCNNSPDARHSAMLPLDLSPKLSISMFYTGQVLMGVGGILVDILSLIFIDDSFATGKASGVMALWYISRYAGPLLGLVVGSASLLRWIDTPDIALVDVDHPGWLGAWWLSYRVIGTILFVAGLLLLVLSNTFNVLFNFKCKSLKSLGSKYLKTSSGDVCTDSLSNSELPMEFLSNNHISFLSTVSNRNTRFFTSFRQIMLNPAFVFSVLGQITTCTVMVGVVSFLPKILLIVFDVPPSKSGFTLAIVGGGAAVVGVFLTSQLIKYFELKKALYKIIVLCVIASMFIALQGLTYWSRIGCEDLTVIGHTSTNLQNVTYLKSSCAAECTCPSLFDPMCDGNGNTYFSPCTAGCQKSSDSDNIFKNCSCLSAVAPTQNDSRSPTSSPSPSQSPLNKPYMGVCKRKCSFYFLFVVIIGLLSFLGVASSAAQNSIVLRCVSSDERALALSIQFSLIKIICYVPSPIIFGSVIDLSCSEWVHTGNLDSQHNCYHVVDKVCMKYNISSLKTSFGSISLAFGLVGSILYIMAYRVTKSRLQ